MNLEMLKELIKNSEEFKAHPSGPSLATHFEKIIELMGLAQNHEAELSTAYFEELGDELGQFWDSFDSILVSIGLPPETIKANLTNADFFPPEQWKMMQGLQQEIFGEKETRSVQKKLKNQKAKVRI